MPFYCCGSVKEEDDGIRPIRFTKDDKPPTDEENVDAIRPIPVIKKSLGEINVTSVNSNLRSSEVIFLINPLSWFTLYSSSKYVSIFIIQLKTFK